MGPRQVGKTTLINALLKDIPFLFLDGDDAVVVDTLAKANTEALKSVIGNYKYVFIKFQGVFEVNRFSDSNAHF